MAQKKNYYGLTLQDEKNYAAYSVDLAVWKDGIPLKPGQSFPTAEMKQRADINKTMDMLVTNQLQEVLDRFINDMPDLNPFQVGRVRDIAASLPIFDSLVGTWVAILAPCFQGVKIDGVDRPDIWESVEENIEDIIRNIFTACDRALVVNKHNNVVNTKIYTDKNIILFRTLEDERIVTLTNVITDDDKQWLECLSYHPDGRCIRDKFRYVNKRIGKHEVVNELVTEDKYILFAKNGNGREDYGYPELIGSVSASLGAIRAFITLSRLTEQAKDIIKTMPKKAARRDPVTDMTTYIDNGVITYDPATAKDQPHDVSIIKPDIDFEGAIKALDTMLKQVSIYSHLSGTILGFEHISGNVSGRLLLASCIPTVLHARGYIKRLSKELKNIVVEVAKYHNIDTDTTDIELITVGPDQTLVDLLDGVNDDETQEGEQV